MFESARGAQIDLGQISGSRFLFAVKCGVHIGGRCIDLRMRFQQTRQKLGQRLGMCRRGYQHAAGGNKPPFKLAPATASVLGVRADSSTGATKQTTAAVEFKWRSNP